MKFTERLSYKAFVHLVKENYTDLRDAEVIICDDTGLEDEISVGVKAPYRIFRIMENGAMAVTQEWAGEYVLLKKDASLSELFECIGRLLEKVSQEIETAQKNGEQA